MAGGETHKRLSRHQLLYHACRFYFMEMFYGMVHFKYNDSFNLFYVTVLSWHLLAKVNNGST